MRRRVLALLVALACCTSPGCSTPIVGTDGGGRACAVDLDCAPGSYCGVASACRTDCVVASDCALTFEPGAACDARGRCLGTPLPDAGPADAGIDAGLDAGVELDVGPLDAAVDAGPRCGTRPAGDPRWPQYRLPGTPGGPTRSYMLVGTETVLDCVTGLEWQRVVDATYTQAAAISYCDGLTLAGHADWRLPTTIELMTLIDYSVASPGPTIDATFFPGTPPGRFWTASPRAGSPGTGWNVAFGYGHTTYDAVAATWPARCVR